MAGEIRSGTMQELEDRSGDWLFIDLGFAETSETCGYLLVSQGQKAGIEEPKKLTFGQLVENVVELAGRSNGPPLHLVLEAPLSAAFTKSGNPLGRKGEREGNKTRYWYLQGGCVVLLAALYLMRAIIDAGCLREIRIFEGFVSFKDGKSDHIADVLGLKDSVWNLSREDPILFPSPINSKKGRDGSTLQATFRLLGLKIDPPIIIVAKPRSSDESHPL